MAWSILSFFILRFENGMVYSFFILRFENGMVYDYTEGEIPSAEAMREGNFMR